MIGAIVLALLYAQLPHPQADVFVAEVQRARAEPWALLLAAQIQEESAWNPNAVSRTGAAGWAQFMPGTRRLVWHRTEPSCEGVPATDPACSVRAQIWLMLDSLESGRCRDWLTTRDKWACALAEYNGGPTALRRERALCDDTPGCDPRRWSDVSKICEASIRDPRNCKENHEYPDRVFGWLDDNLWVVEALTQ